MTTSPTHALGKWPSRAAVLEDAQAHNPDLKMVAVHRWFQRLSVAKEYIPALMEGARRRDIEVSFSELANLDTRHEYQHGHRKSPVQDADSDCNQSGSAA